MALQRKVEAAQKAKAQEDMEADRRLRDKLEKMKTPEEQERDSRLVKQMQEEHEKALRDRKERQERYEKKSSMHECVLNVLSCCL